jgi:hypothetical protein
MHKCVIGAHCCLYVGDIQPEQQALLCCWLLLLSELLLGSLLPGLQDEMCFNFVQVNSSFIPAFPACFAPCTHSLIAVPLTGALELNEVNFTC